MTAQESGGGYRFVGNQDGLEPVQGSAQDPTLVNEAMANDGQPTVANAVVLPRAQNRLNRVANYAFRTRGGRIATASFVAAGSILGVGANAFSGSAKPAGAATAAQYTVGSPTYNCAEGPITIGADALTVANVDGTRLWNDAIEPPMTDPSNESGDLSQVLTKVCDDPLFGVTAANMFANMKVAGANIGDLNPWDKKYQFSAEGAANDIAEDASSFFSVKNSDGSETTTPASEAAYELLANDVDSLIQRFDYFGRATHPTTENYQLSGNGGTSDAMPQVRLNPKQYDADAVWFGSDEKTGGCFPEFGFNIGDMRPETSDVCVETPQTPLAPIERPTPTTTEAPKKSTPTTTAPKRVHSTTTTTTSLPASTTTSTTVMPTTTTTVAPTTTTTVEYAPSIWPPDQLEPIDEGGIVEVCESAHSNPASDGLKQPLSDTIQYGSVTLPEYNGSVGEYCEVITAPDFPTVSDILTVTATDLKNGLKNSASTSYTVRQPS